MNKIKVLHIIKSLGRGGAEVLLPETLALHDKTRFEFHYIYFLPWKDQMVNAIEKNQGKVVCIPAKNNWELISKSKNVIQYCKQHEIDVIHCHLPWSGFLGRRVFSKTKIPLLYTEHNIQERYQWITKLINKYSFNFQTKALAVSKDVTLSIEKNISPKIPVQTVLNGVNTERFRRDHAQGLSLKQELGIPEGSIVIGNIAVFRDQKKLQDWVKAFNQVNKETSNIHGILVGAGPKENEIRKLIKELGLEDKISLPGLQENTIPYFSAMDIFMLSSAFEGLPIALLEAMSMNCAIVSTKAGGVVEVVRDGKEGLLSEPENWQELADNLKILVEDSGKRDRLKKASRERILEEFSLINMVKELEELYQNFKR